MKPLSHAFAILFLFGCVACGPPRIRIEWSQPAAFNLPNTVPVAVIVEKDGVQPTANNVLDAFGAVTQGQVMNKWLAVEPVKQEFTAALTKQGYQIVDSSKAQAIIKLRPVAWSYELDAKQKQDFRNGVGKLEVKVDVYDAKNQGGAPVYSETYWARGSAANIGEPEAMVRAARNLPGAFFSDLEPRRVSARVYVDDEDESAEPGIQLIRDNQFNAAYDFFHDAVERNPDSAPLLYNYAVMAEIKGQYDQSEALLLRATKLKQKPMYYSALERVRGARNDAQAMNSQ